MANENEIEEYFKQHKISLDEPILCGLVRGAFRLGEFKLALEISSYLNTVLPTINSRIFLARSKFFTFFQVINKPCYWYVNATQYRETLELCDTFVSLIDELEFNDQRVIECVVNLLAFTMNEYEQLVNCCWKHLHKVEEFYPEVACILREKFDSNFEPEDFIYKESIKAKNDSTYKNSLISTISQSSEITPEQFEIFRRFADPGLLSTWLKNGSIKTESDLQNDFCLFELAVLSCQNCSRPDRQQLEIYANRFLSHGESILSINPYRIKKIVERLYYLKAFSINCNLLKALVPENDLWASPPVEIYLQSLLYSEQLNSLQHALSSIAEAEITHLVYAVSAHQYERLHKYENAINEIELAINLAPDISSYWEFLIFLHQKNASNSNILKSVTNRIPNSIFDNYSESKISLLYQVAKFGEFKLVEETLIRWFIADPIKLAIPITSFEHSKMMDQDIDHQSIVLSSTVGNCLGGFVYKADGHPLTRLIVSDSINNQHEYFLSDSSPIKASLDAMEINQSKIINYKKVELIEKLPPYIAVFRIASQIRDNSNDGLDGYFVLTPPSDPDELFQYV